MERLYKKLFSAIEADISCAIKNGCENMCVGSTSFFHNHDGYELTLILNGQLNILMDNQSYLLSRGDLILIPPYIFHGSFALLPDEYQRIVISVREPVMKELSTNMTDLSVCFFRTPALMANIIHLSEREIIKYCEYANSLHNSLSSNEFGSDVLSSSLMCQLLVYANRLVSSTATPKYRNHLSKLMTDTFQYINTHLTGEISLKSISEHVHHNATYVNRLFKKETGTTLQQYIIAKKIALAQKYLRESYSPCDACFMSGFNNYSHFSRTFTRQIGQSPRNYQAQFSSKK